MKTKEIRRMIKSLSSNCFHRIKESKISQAFLFFQGQKKKRELGENPKVIKLILFLEKKITKEIVHPEIVIEEYLIVTVKKFIFKLKKALIHLDLKHVSENMLKMINDKVYFHGYTNYSSKVKKCIIFLLKNEFLEYFGVFALYRFFISALFER